MQFALHGIAQRRGLFLVMEAEVREMAGFFFEHRMFSKKMGHQFETFSLGGFIPSGKLT